MDAGEGRHLDGGGGCRQDGQVWSGQDNIPVYFSFFRWTEQFSSACPEDGKLTGGKAKAVMMESKLPNSVLSKIWSLADTDRDGLLSLSEFCLAMYLIDIKLAGHDLPTQLPEHLKPPIEEAGAEADMEQD